METTPEPKPRARRNILQWASLVTALAAIAISIFLYSVLEQTRNDLERRTLDYSNRSSDLESRVSGMQTDISAMVSDITVPPSKMYGPYSVYCGTEFGYRYIDIEAPMSRVTFSFTVVGSNVYWGAYDPNINTLVEQMDYTVNRDGGSFIAATTGEYKLWFLCAGSSIPSTVVLAYTVYPPAPIISGI